MNDEQTTPPESQTTEQSVASPELPEAPAAPEPETPLNPVISGPEPPKKTKKVLLIILIVLLVGALIAAVAFFFLKKDKKETPQNDSQQTSQSSESTPQELVASLKTEAFKLAGEQNSYKYEEVTGESSNPDVTYSVDGSSYYVRTDDNQGAGFVMRTDPVNTSSTAVAQADAARKTTATSLNEYAEQTLGMKKIDNITIAGPAMDFNDNVYQKDNVICEIPSGTTDLFSISAGCVTQAELNSKYEQLKPFITLYEKEVPQSASTSVKVYSGPTYSDGSNGYKRAMVFGEHAGRIFFARKSDTAEWQYVGTYSYQSMPACEEYQKIPLAKTVFAGEPCVTASGESTVQ